MVKLLLSSVFALSLTAMACPGKSCCGNTPKAEKQMPKTCADKGGKCKTDSCKKHCAKIEAAKQKAKK